MKDQNGGGGWSNIDSNEDYSETSFAIELILDLCDEGEEFSCLRCKAQLLPSYQLLNSEAGAVWTCATCGSAYTPLEIMDDFAPKKAAS